MEWRNEADMKKVKCWKCDGTGKVPLELPRICIGAPRLPDAQDVRRLRREGMELGVGLPKAGVER